MRAISSRPACCRIAKRQFTESPANWLIDVTLANYAGKRKVLNIVPSLDTPTCATQLVPEIADEPNYDAALKVL